MGITQLYIIQPLEANFSPQTETETGSFQSGVWGILFFLCVEAVESRNVTEGQWRHMDDVKCRIKIAECGMIYST